MYEYHVLVGVCTIVCQNVMSLVQVMSISFAMLCWVQCPCAWLIHLLLVESTSLFISSFVAKLWPVCCHLYCEDSSQLLLLYLFYLWRSSPCYKVELLSFFLCFSYPVFVVLVGEYFRALHSILYFTCEEYFSFRYYLFLFLYFFTFVHQIFNFDCYFS